MNSDDVILVTLIAFSVAFSQMPAMLQDHEYMASALCGVPVYAPAATKLYCLVTEAHRSEQLAQGCYSTTRWPGLEPVTIKSLARCPSH